MPFFIPDSLAIQALKDHIDNCDADELSWLLGECFGGNCVEYQWESEVYEFEPNELYLNTFGEIVDCHLCKKSVPQKTCSIHHNRLICSSCADGLINSSAA